MSLGIGLSGDLDEPGGEPDLILLGQSEHLARGRAGNHVPGGDLAAIAGDRLADEVAGLGEDLVEIPLPEPEPVGQGATTEVDQGTGGGRQPLLAAPVKLGIGLLPAEARLDGGDTRPVQREPGRVGGDQQGGRPGLSLGDAIEPDGQERRELRGQVPTLLQDLIGVRLHQPMSGEEGVLERLARRGAGDLDPVLRGGRAGEAALGKPQRLLDLLGHHQTHLLPVGELVADVVELAASQFHAEVVGFQTLGQSRGADERGPLALDRPGDRESPTLGRIAMDDQQTRSHLDLDPRRGSVGAGHERLAEVVLSRG